jgi:hypothetical protein
MHAWFDGKASLFVSKQRKPVSAPMMRLLACHKVEHTHRDSQKLPELCQPRSNLLSI